MKWYLVTFVNTVNQYGKHQASYYTQIINELSIAEILTNQGGGTESRNSVHFMQEVSEEMDKSFNDNIEKIFRAKINE